MVSTLKEDCLCAVTLTENVSVIIHDNRMLAERAFYCLLLKQNKKANAYEKIHENHLYKHIISYNRSTASLGFCALFSPFSALFHRKRCKYRFSPNKSDDPCHINSGDASCRIDRHVPKRRRASCHKHLMVLI